MDPEEFNKLSEQDQTKVILENMRAERAAGQSWEVVIQHAKDALEIAVVMMRMIVGDERTIGVLQHFVIELIEVNLRNEEAHDD